MASVKEKVAAELNSVLKKAAKRIYRQNVKLSPEEVAEIIENHLRHLLDEKGVVKYKAQTLAYKLAQNAATEVDNVT